MRNKKRLLFLGVLCAGLLLVGVGAGMGLAEAATFTYAGDRVLPEAAELQTQTLALSTGTSEMLTISSQGRELHEQLREVGHVETSEDVAPGMVLFELTYKTAGTDIDAWIEHGEDGEPIGINLYWYGRNEIGAILACKDQILADIRDRKLGNYTAAELTDAVITVNPADAERVTIG